MPIERNFENQHVVITGGSSGIGLCLAQDLALRGARLTLVGRDATKLAQAAAQVHGPVQVASIVLTEEQAVAVADDVTDLQVVVSGVAAACALPGDRLYEEVQRSNLSKAQEDGSIARDPSGKWIKGPNYSAPNLRAVLFPE